jgi:hypothetical protein
MVGRIGEDLLIACHAGVKDHLPHRDTPGPETPSVKYRPIGEGKGGAGFVVLENLGKGRHYSLQKQGAGNREPGVSKITLKCKKKLREIRSFEFLLDSGFWILN